MRILIFVLTFFLIPNVLAQSSRVDQRFGFRDLSFGQRLDSKQFTLDSKKNPKGIEQYTRKNENLKLGQANLHRITYISVAGKLARVRIESAPNGDDAYKLVAVAKESYGSPDESLDAGTGTVIYAWKGNKAVADVFLTDKRNEKKANLFISDIAQRDYISNHLNELNKADDL